MDDRRYCERNRRGDRRQQSRSPRRRRYSPSERRDSRNRRHYGRERDYQYSRPRRSSSEYKRDDHSQSRRTFSQSNRVSKKISKSSSPRSSKVPNKENRSEDDSDKGDRNIITYSHRERSYNSKTRNILLPPPLMSKIIENPSNEEHQCANRYFKQPSKEQIEPFKAHQNIEGNFPQMQIHQDQKPILGSIKLEPPTPTDPQLLIKKKSTNTQKLAKEICNQLKVCGDMDKMRKSLNDEMINLPKFQNLLQSVSNRTDEFLESIQSYVSRDKKPLRQELLRYLESSGIMDPSVTESILGELLDQNSPLNQEFHTKVNEALSVYSILYK